MSLGTKAFIGFVRWVILRRWPLSPLMLIVVAVVAAQDRAKSAPQLLVIIALFGVASIQWRPALYSRLRKKPRGHHLVGAARPAHVFPLSLMERQTAAMGFGAVLLWLGITMFPMTRLLSALILLGLLGYPAHQWVRSPIRRAPKLSPLAKNVLALWADKCAPKIKGLEGSRPIRASITDLDGDGLTMQVLLDGVHPNMAVSDQVRMAIEAALSGAPIALPVDSVELAVARDDGGANRIIVTITPTRHLELTPTAWQGPILNKDGSMPIAQSVDGSIAHVNLFNDSGTESGLVSGGTGTGKSNSGTVVTAPGILANREIMIYVDGGGGTSNPLMRRMATIGRPDTDHCPDKWMEAIDIFCSIAESRQERWAKTGEFGRDKYRFHDDPEPVITLFLEEARFLRVGLPREYADKVGNLQLIIRKLGMRMIQSVQSLRSDQFLGDAITRSNATQNGFVIAHAVGSPQDAMASTSGIKVPGITQALGKVPAKSGMALISRSGELIAPCARVFLTEVDLPALLDEREAQGWRPLQFTGEDLAAVLAVTGEPGQERPVRPSPMALKSNDNNNVLKIDAALTANPDGLTSRQIIDTTEIPDSTVYRLLKSMGEVIKTNEGTYRLAELVLDDIQDTPTKGDAMSDAADGQAAA